MRAFVSLSDPIWDRVSRVLEADYPAMCICWIERIDNPAVRAAYEARRQAIQQARGHVSERVLFHGTKAHAVDAIVRDGFRVACNTVSAWGRGTYFATSAAMSAGYTDVREATEMSYMFVCNVLVGRCKTGVPNETVDVAVYDNTSNVATGEIGSIVTTPYDDGAYPEYLVGFYKNSAVERPRPLGRRRGHG